MAPKERNGGLETLGLGGRIREIRERAQLTLLDLAAKTGIDREVLAGIERDEVVPPVSTLLKLGRAMNVGMANFFMDEVGGGKISLTRKGERIRIKKRPHHHEGEVDYIYESLEPHRPDKHMEPLFVEFQPLETGDLVFSSHDGEEFVYLLEGRLEFRTDDRVEILEEGDALYFESDINHAFRGLDGKAARAVVVVWNRP
ncbi:MAG TPA: XRE family transcriptional regulator [Syntrophales bacterium]|nr:XRE family transcriptional regulator [Syntrophales bacterium]HOM06735.1 XRE family transcriptional regulator [Syntrophales bacterium]HOO00057.1 XRE family transcriptional regulator [Syntrophales bacterium]HPC01644.1 XRE family transcriptional regulator [Syntrophales bacterium]HPQ06107.1 XRE family transcriptional regulator [Syntrophales bacterium]